MEILKVDLKNPKKADLEKIIDYLKVGKTIAYPTDTVYGLGCRADDLDAIKKVYAIKQRPLSKKSLVLIKSYCMLKKYFFVSSKQDKYLRQIWPGPVTVILKNRELLPEELASERGISVRLPKSDFLIKIIKGLNVPLLSTSFNISGQETIRQVKGVEEKLGKIKPNLIIDGGTLKNSKPSRLIDISDINNIEILRK